MKGLLGIFELTVAEQRVIIVLLLLMLGFVTAKTYRDAQQERGTLLSPTHAPVIEPSPDATYRPGARP